MVKFDRKVKLTAGDLELRSEEVTIHGRIPFSERWEDNIAEIVLFNVKDSTISRIGEAQSIQIDAGYEGEIGSLYEGLIRGIRTTEDDGEKRTEIRTGTGFLEFDRYISQDNLASVSPEQILDDILSKTRLIERGNFVIRGDPYPKRSIHRSAIREVEGIGRDFGVATYLRQLQLFAEPSDAVVPTRNTSLTPRQGLNRQRKAFSRFRDDEVVEINSLLNRNVFQGATVTLSDTDLDGIYRVIDGTHSLTEFTTTASLVEVG